MEQGLPETQAEQSIHQFADDASSSQTVGSQGCTPIQGAHGYFCSHKLRLGHKRLGHRALVILYSNS